MKNFLTTLFSILTPHEKAKLLTNSLFDFFIALLDIVFLACLILLVNFYNNPQGAHAIFIKNVFGSGAVLPAGLFLILFAIKNGFGYYVLKRQGTFFLQVASRLSERNLWQYLHGDYANFINNDSSVYIRKISQQPIEFSTYVLNNLQQVISQIMLILLTVIGLLFYHSLLFLALFALLLPPVFIIAFILKKKLMNVRANIKTTSQLTLQHVQESLSAFVESNIFIKHSFFVNRYKRFQQQLNNNIATQQNLQGLPARMMEVFAVFGLFMLVAIDSRSSQGSGAGFLDTGIFMATAYKIIPGIVKISNSLGQVKTYLFTLTELAEPATIAAEDTPPVPMVKIGSVNFHAVSFGYTSRQILTDFNLDINHGDFIGISGHSGSGKTTILNLLAGFLIPQSGCIIINGKKLTKQYLNQYRSRMSYVKQQPFLINDTILKNICLIENHYDAGKLDWALNFCGLDKMLARLPDGLDTPISEDGKNISGGQRQRLVLARALYHDFDLLLLDEPFSELDAETEHSMLMKLRELASAGKMILMITHHQHSLAYCNKIVSLNEEYA